VYEKYASRPKTRNTEQRYCCSMSSDSIIEKALGIIEARGRNALEDACQELLQSKFEGGMLSGALHYYAKFIFPRVLPIFPALISLSCELVGGKPEKTRSLGAAMMLITASGDVHDDIIDRSTHKFRRKTVFGKYGNDIALLVGDALLVQGMLLFQERCESLDYSQRTLISNLIGQSFFEISKAEAIESNLWKKSHRTRNEYYEIIRLKGSVAELQCRIGGILGNADEKELDSLADYGRAVGILSTMKDEFLDILSFSELQHRFKNELPPYPIFCALQNELLKKQINPIIEKSAFSRKNLKIIVNLVLKSKEVQKIKMDLKSLGENELKNNILLKKPKMGKEAAILLQALNLDL
jgi:geranylgeranyl pyrophosphate synthase